MPQHNAPTWSTAEQEIVRDGLAQNIRLGSCSRDSSPSALSSSSFHVEHDVISSAHGSAFVASKDTRLVVGLKAQAEQRANNCSASSTKKPTTTQNLLRDCLSLEVQFLPGVQSAYFHNADAVAQMLRKFVLPVLEQQPEDVEQEDVETTTGPTTTTRTSFLNPPLARCLETLRQAGFALTLQFQVEISEAGVGLLDAASVGIGACLESFEMPVLGIEYDAGRTRVVPEQLREQGDKSHGTINIDDNMMRFDEHAIASLLPTARTMAVFGKRTEQQEQHQEPPAVAASTGAAGEKEKHHLQIMNKTSKQHGIVFNPSPEEAGCCPLWIAFVSRKHGLTGLQGPFGETREGIPPEVILQMEEMFTATEGGPRGNRDRADDVNINMEFVDEEDEDVVQDSPTMDQS
ncbi:unnamed protein product [Amoebophrya sp. A120]|nr:unnamed protein product [Amoebophrya sp. A120]|eukprot:GSA120T00022584001.1